MRPIDYGNLDRKTANVDQALYVASCFAGQAPQVVYSSTHKSVADPDTGERYLVFDEEDPARFHLKSEEGWDLTYRLERIRDSGVRPGVYLMTRDAE